MLISLGLQFRQAGVQVREKFFLGHEAVQRLYATPRPSPVSEMAFVSTCNRLEMYAWCEGGDRQAAVDELATRWSEQGGQRKADLLAASETAEDVPAAQHLLRVTSGIESQVLGDAQILGQVRRAYEHASEAGAVGPVLHRLFHTSMRAAKRVQNETGLIGGRQSVGAEAAAVAARRAGPLERRRVLIIGCGKTGERAARQLMKFGASDIVLINRSPGRAQALAMELGGRAAPFGELHREMARADVAIVATSAEQPPVRARSLRFCREMAGTMQRPLLLLDLSVPRNIEAEAGGLDGITLVDLDELHTPVVAAQAARMASVPAAEQILTQELSDFLAWLADRPAREAIRPLREALDEICRREVAFAAGDEVADRLANRIVAKLLAHPMRSIRLAAERGEPIEPLTGALQTLFNLPRPGRDEGTAQGVRSAE